MKNKEVLATNVPIDALVNIETKCITKVRKYMKMFFFIGSLAAMGLFLNSCMEGYVTTEPTYVEYSRPQRPHDDYIWIGENILVTNDADAMIFTVSTDNGASYSASNYWVGNANDVLAGPSANVTIASLNNSTYIPMTFTMKFYNPNANSYSKQMEFKGFHPNSGGGGYQALDKHLMWNTVGAGTGINAFKINISSGLSGTFKFYGIKKS